MFKDKSYRKASSGAAGEGTQARENSHAFLPMTYRFDHRPLILIIGISYSCPTGRWPGPLAYPYNHRRWNTGTRLYILFSGRSGAAGAAAAAAAGAPCPKRLARGDGRSSRADYRRERPPGLGAPPFWYTM